MVDHGPDPEGCNPSQHWTGHDWITSRSAFLGLVCLSFGLLIVAQDDKLRVYTAYTAYIVHIPSYIVTS
ncbi:hypothetical protein DM02DRAFT_250416 [Periconia macrospinosa]|uniref:Uncharacterized protein n=1 Tax=Periconia macrospinosa TaxID=97972 RepID=A0A2V1D4V5_9PLEO|nr:hypothetical protein DM02DRAFT_250416 [Periconia macrospinosa]